MSLRSIAFRFDHKNKVLILLELNDGKLAVYSSDKIIHIFKKSLSPSFKIKSINSVIKSMIQTKDLKLICCSYEITILKLYDDHYETLQIIKAWSNKIIEINDEFNNNIQLISSQNNFIRKYQLSQNNKNIYELNKEFDLEKNINNMLYIKNDDYALILDNYFKYISINIYDMKLFKNKIKLYEIKAKESGDMCILKNKYLIVSFYLYLILIDIEDEYKLIHEIKTSFGCVNSFCALNALNNNNYNYIFLSGDDIGDIIEWKIKDNKIIKIKEYNNSKKEINSIINFKQNSWIATGANDGFVKFYEINL